MLVVIKGGGDLGSGVAWRLHRCGFRVAILECSRPTAIRRRVAFATAMYEGEITLEGVTARRATPEESPVLLEAGLIPVLDDPEGRTVKVLWPDVLVDAIMAKCNTGTHLTDAPLVVGLGPGFRAGRDCHAVVETARGHFLGRVYWQGEALPNTRTPGEVAGVAEERVLRAPATGTFRSCAQIGDRVEVGQTVALVDGHPVQARLRGVLRGLLADGLSVHVGMKVGDVDPRGERSYCWTISDKALAIAGGVLEAIFSWFWGIMLRTEEGLYGGRRDNEYGFSGILTSIRTKEVVMSFLDRVGKAISETAARARQELDQMARINRIRGEIRDIEKKVKDFQEQIRAAQFRAGERALEMLRSGTLQSAELQPFADEIARIEQEIAACQEEIARKEAAIEAIKAEAPAPAQPAPQEGQRFCPQCGVPAMPGAAFCAQCGAKLS